MKIHDYIPFTTLQEKKTAFYIGTIGNVKSQVLVHRPLGIQDYQLLYTVSGKGAAFVQGETYELKKGSILFSPPNTAHEYHRLTSEWETLFITFNGCGIPGFFDPEAAVWNADFDFEGWWKLLHAYRQDPKRARDLSISLYAMLLELKDAIRQPLSPALKKQHVLAQAMHYLAEEKEPQLSTLASMLHMSEAHLCRLFKEYTGYRPFEYMNLIRLQKARELLQSSSLSVGEVARACGYESHSYFTMLFKRHTGMTPTEYRQML